jgi:hypothetical protein
MNSAANPAVELLNMHNAEEKNFNMIFCSKLVDTSIFSNISFKTKRYQ